MSQATELGLIVATARRDILNRETIRHCKMIYDAIMTQAMKGARLGCYTINGNVELDPNVKYDLVTIVNQLQLKLELEEFGNVLMAVKTLEIFPSVTVIDFSFEIPEVELPATQKTQLEF
jgi:hypothetical protein